MKTTKRILAILIAVVFIASMVIVPTYAATSDGKITVTNPVKDEEYTLYKVFDVPYYTETAEHELDRVAYTYPATGNADFITALGTEASPFNAQLNGDVYSISLKDGKTAEDIETFIKANIANIAPYGETKTATDDPVEFTGLPYGYYFVTTTVGSFATIDTAAKEVEIQEKNTMPTITKEVKEDSTATWGEEADFSIGQEIPYKATVAIGKGNDKDITLTDTLENQVFDEDSVAIDGWTKGTDYTVAFNADKTVMTIVLKAAKVKTLNDGTKSAVVTYSAMFDETKADLTKAEGNDNTVVLEYSHKTAEDSTKVKTYQFDLVKTDADNKTLTGAQFTLWTADTDGTQVGLIYDDTLNAYRPVVEGETATVVDMSTVAKMNFYGLDSDVVYLQEDVAPAGFNKLTERKEIDLTSTTVQNSTATITDGTYVSGGIQVINNTGTELPSTGGTGTIIFITIGAIIAAAAGIFFITNKRMAKEDI